MFSDRIANIPDNHFWPKKITLSKEDLKDKIMGGWAGQTIGVTFGGPYEFRFSGSYPGLPATGLV